MTFEPSSEPTHPYSRIQYAPNPTHAPPVLGHGHPDGAWASASPLRDMSSTGLSPQAVASPPVAAPLDPSKPSHPEWGVIKEQDFHPLTLKHQRDLENHYQSGKSIEDFYFWQANLGGYCMANMIQNIVVSSEGVYVLTRRIVEGAPHPGRRTRRRGMG